MMDIDQEEFHIDHVEDRTTLIKSKKIIIDESIKKKEENLYMDWHQ